MTAFAEAVTDVTSEPYRSRRNHWNNHVCRHALTTPDEPAITFLGQTRTWTQIDDRSRAFAAALSRRGVEFGDRVMMALLNRTEYVEAILGGATLIGAIAVPVNVRMSPGEIAYLMTDSGAEVVVTESALTGVVDAARAWEAPPTPWSSSVRATTPPTIFRSRTSWPRTPRISRRWTSPPRTLSRSSCTPRAPLAVPKVRC